MTGLCGGKTRAGTPCARPKGWGTDHPGVGRCKFHGGASPSGRKAANRERSLTFARGMLGAEVAGTPLDALEQSVRLASGIVDYYRHELADAAAVSLKAGAKADAERERARRRLGELVGPYTESVKLLKDVSKAATDAGVAERRTLLAERTAAMLGAAFEDALAEVTAEVLDAALRAAVVARFVARLHVLEVQADEPLALASGR